MESDELEFLQKLLLNTMQKCTGRHMMYNGVHFEQVRIHRVYTHTEYQAAYHPILDHVDIMVKMITPAALFHCGATRKAHPMYISRAVGQLCCSTLPQGGPPTVPDLTTEQAMQVVYHFCTLACYGSFGGQDDTLGFESMAEMVLALYPALVAVVSNPDLLYSLHHTLLARYVCVGMHVDQDHAYKNHVHTGFYALCCGSCFLQGLGAFRTPSALTTILPTCVTEGASLLA